MTGLHFDSHPTVASGSCCTGRGATAAGSSAGARPRRASFHGTPSSSPEKGGSRPRRASFHGTPPSSPEKGRKTRSRGGSSGDAKRPQRAQSSRPAEDVRAPRGAPLRPEDVMAQALQREGLAHEPPSREPLPSRSASWHTEPREAQGWGAPREHPRRSQSMHPGGGGDTQQLSMQRLKHILAPAAPAHWSGAPPVRSQTWHPSVATRPEDLAAEKVRRGANRPATLYDPTCSAGAGNKSAASTSPRALTYCTCVTYAQVMQQQFNHDVRAAEQELAAEARGGVNTTRIEALRLKMQRWPLSPTSWVGFCNFPSP